ncbi:MAG: T9SS type A sorting domain-containing protein [Vicingaceae bacterium]|nr:T9SS type A sorting domain-containing protein [Vicingaceae bacterium]
MKKTLLSLLAIIAISSTIVAQNCVPDGQFTAPGVYPDSVTNLPTAYVGQPYSEVITAVTPADTCVVILFPPCQIADIDSVIVTSVTGLPPGFTIVSENENALPFKFLGGTSSCMLITGNPTVLDTGHYPISVNGTTYATVFSLTQTQPFDVNYYFIDIIDTTGSTVSVNELAGNKFAITQNYPNPFNNTSTIEFNTPTAEVVELTVFNLLGKVIRTEKISTNSGKNTYTLSANDYENGVYFYQLTYQAEKITKRFIVNK